MPRGAIVFLIGAFLLQPGAPASGQAPGPLDCTDWRECRQQTEAALAAGDAERAQDLAWRTVQRGPKDDPELMFLLARTQSVSGRPHDALVMIRRLADRGVPTEALTHPDLERMRALPAWPDTESIVARVNAGEPGNPVATSAAAAAGGGSAAKEAKEERGSRRASSRNSRGDVAPPSVPATPRSTTRTESPVAVEEALRFSADRFVAAGLAYDAVSRRFVFGDRDGRKLRVVGVGLDHAVDLVRAESAGFFNVRALDIDTRRGDLWVVSGNDGGSAGALHQLQLVSGRPLQTVPFASDVLPVWPVDLAVTGSGSVIVLDRKGRLLRLRPGTTAIELLVPFEVDDATSVAAAGEGVLYVAHREGVSRVDVAARAVTALAAPDDVSLVRFERLRPYRDGLVGLQTDTDGTRRVVELALTPNSRRVRAATVFDTRFEAGVGPLAFGITGDEVSLIAGAPDSSQPAAGPPGGGPAELTVLRLRLR